MNDVKTEKIKCEVDGAEAHHLPSYLAEKHNMTVEEYLDTYPGAPLESDALVSLYESRQKKVQRSQPPKKEELFVDVGGFSLPVNWDVDESACLPLPDHYRIPTKGHLGKEVKRAARYFVSGRSFWIWGPPGSGKDAFPSALCALTRTPSAIFPINPDVDILSWFYDKSFVEGETRWEFGELFNALVHGYRSPYSGRKVPMTVVLSDFDRAGRTQAEAIRLVADSIQSRVKGPRGETYPVLPGTRIVVTANTMGSGDSTGKYVSANVLDSSLLDRIERKVKFHAMDWKDEEPILRAKFPLFSERCGHLFSTIGDVTHVLRKSVEEQSLYGEFSHRGLCAWVGDCEDILRYQSRIPKNLLREGFLSFVDGLPDEENRNLALTLADPYFKGGALDQGDTSHVQKDKELSL